MRARLAALATSALAFLAGCASTTVEQPVAQSPDAPLDAALPPEMSVPLLDDRSLEGLTPGVTRAFMSDRADAVIIPLDAIPESFDASSVAPAELVAFVRIGALVEYRWLPTRRLERTSLDDPRAAIRAVVIPRRALGDRESLRFADGREVEIRGAPLPASTPAPLAESFSRLGPALLDPSMRWRARLALDRFGVHGAGERFPDPAVEAYAIALELRARAAIDALRTTDSALADRLHASLGRTLIFPGGVIAPAWPESDAGLDDTLKVLLDDSVDGALAADRVRQWLGAQPRAVAWIANDSGLLGTRVLVAELGGVADLVAARVAPTESCDPATLHPILPRSVAEFDLKCRERPARRAIRVQVGDWSTTLDALAAPTDVSPPGLRVGPLMLPHSMRSLLASQVTLPDSAHATAALIRRKASSDEWQIYAECLSPLREREDSAARANDALRVYFGLRESPRAVLEIRADGSATLRLGGENGDGASLAIGATVREDSDRWVAFADVPPDAFEPNGTLIVGFERVDARGVRSVWPRPVLPWEDTPSRVAMDPSTWARLGAR
jgi:hypothetical protein